MNNLKILFNCQEEDAVVFVIGKINSAILAIDEIVLRIKESFAGVPKETRHALDDGTTSFRRYLGGAARMYPDTDLYPIVITTERVKKIQEILPELPEKKEERYLKDFRLPLEIAKNLAISYNAPVFDDLVRIGVDPILAAITLEQTLKALQRNAIPIENLTDDKIKEIFKYLLEKKIVKEAIESLLIYFSKNPRDEIDKALVALNLEALSEEKLREIVQNTIKENIDFIKEKQQKALGKLMGRVMEQVRGKVDGKAVNQLVNLLFDEKIKELNENK